MGTGRQGAPQRERTSCPHGHPYDSTNTYVPPGRINRMCRICKRARDVVRWQNRKRAA